MKFKLQIICKSLIIFLFVSDVLTSNLMKSNNDSNIKSNPDNIIYDKDSVLKFIKELGREVLSIPELPIEKKVEKQRIFEECFNYIRENPNEFSNDIRNFYSRCLEIKDDVKSKWSNDIFQSSIMSKLSTVRVKDMGANSTCSVSLSFKVNVDLDRISKIFHSQYARYNPKPSNAMPFITSMFSVHREHLPSYAFVKLQQESNGSSEYLKQKLNLK